VVLIWWVIVRGRLPVLPFIGEPNGGPFYLRLSRAAFVVLLGLSLALGVAQAWAGWVPPDAAPDRMFITKCGTMMR